MASFNKTILVGNLSRDVEIKYLQSGTAVVEVGIAVNDKVRKNNEWVDECSFFECVFWGKTAEILSEYCSKGSSILVDGRLKQETWEKDGQKHSKVRVIVENFKMLGSKPAGNSQGDAPKQDRPKQQQQSRQQPQRQSAPPQQEEDIPF